MKNWEGIVERVLYVGRSGKVGQKIGGEKQAIKLRVLLKILKTYYFISLLKYIFKEFKQWYPTLADKTPPRNHWLFFFSKLKDSFTKKKETSGQESCKSQ